MIISNLLGKHTDGRQVYQPVYDEFLTDDVCTTVRNVLELGIQYGIGLAAWLECLPEATVYGLDCTAVGMWRRDIAGDPRLITYIGNSAVREDAIQFFDTIGNAMMDIIIDDADHQETSQLATLENFLPILSPGGVYIIEDTGPRDDDDPFVQKIRSMCGDRKVYARPVSNLAGVVVVAGGALE